jgi:hypothetical protein
MLEPVLRRPLRSLSIHERRSVVGALSEDAAAGGASAGACAGAVATFRAGAADAAAAAAGNAGAVAVGASKTGGAGVPVWGTSGEVSWADDSAGVEPHPSFFLMKLNMR